MRTRLWNMVSMTNPSVCRGCQEGLLIPQIARAFSSFRPLNAQNSTSRETGIAVEKQILEKGIENENHSSSGSLDALSSIAELMKRGDPNRSGFSGNRPGVGRPSQDYRRISAGLEEKLMPQPYADRAPPHQLHVYSHKHNTIITLTRPNGNPLMSLGCGNLGFRKSQRSGYDPAYQLSSHVFAQILEKGLLPDIHRIELVLRGFGQGREAFTKVLLGNEGRNIRPLIARVTDATRIKFGGTRSRQVRRLG